MDGRETPRPDADPACRDCRHLWITHERETPWGCRGFGIKSARPPAIAVREATGRPCNAFEPKAPIARPRES